MLVREVVRSGDLGSRVVERDEALEAIERIVAQGQERGEFSAELDPRLASLIVYGALEEILTGWVLGRLPGRRRGDRARRAHVHRDVRERVGAAASACANLTR